MILTISLNILKKELYKTIYSYKINTMLNTLFIQTGWLNTYNISFGMKIFVRLFSVRGTLRPTLSSLGTYGSYMNSETQDGRCVSMSVLRNA